jgi:PhnB protein
MPTKPIPDACRTAIPYLIVNGASRAIDFYQAAFGATELVRLADPTGKVMHAEIRIGDATLMLADEFPEMGYRSPESLGGSPVSLLLYEGAWTLFSPRPLQQALPKPWRWQINSTAIAVGHGRPFRPRLVTCQ